jgi:hypothetical protein
VLGSVPRKCGPECAGEGVKEKKGHSECVRLLELALLQV